MHIPGSTLKTIPIAWPFAIWGIDMVGRLKTAASSFTHLLVAVDKFTKWVEAKPIVTPSESTLCKFQRFPPNPHRNDSKVPSRHFRAGGKRSNNITQQSSMGPTEQIYIYNSDSKSQEYRYNIQRSKSP